MRTVDYLEGDVVVLKVHGKIMGGDEVTRFHGIVSDYISRNKRHFVVDLADVVWSNSLGLGMLVACLHAAKRAGGKMVLANVTNLQSLLAMTRLITVFDCFDSTKIATRVLADSIRSEVA